MTFENSRLLLLPNCSPHPHSEPRSSWSWPEGLQREGGHCFHLASCQGSAEASVVAPWQEVWVWNRMQWRRPRAASLSRVRLCVIPWTYLPGSAVGGIGVGARPSARASSQPRHGNCVSTSPALQLGSLPLVPAGSPRKHQAAGQRPSQDVGPAPRGG